MVFDEKYYVIELTRSMRFNPLGGGGIKRRERNERQELDDGQQKKQQGEALRETICQRL